MLRAGETSLMKSAGLRMLFEGLVPDGAEYLRDVDFSRRHNSRTGIHLQEAANAVDSSVFSNIIGGLRFLVAGQVSVISTFSKGLCGYAVFAAGA